MRYTLVCCCILLLQPFLFGQFPHTRKLEIRSGQQRPAITCIAQDEHGLLWLGTDLGLLRTDGELLDVMFRTDLAGVSSLIVAGIHAYAAIRGGPIIRCGPMTCDTILVDPRLSMYAVNAMVVDQKDQLWLGTHGAGIWVIDLRGGGNGIKTIAGLRDEHVNDLAMLQDGRVVAATDQGLALCTDHGATHYFGESEGAPDNLTISVAVEPNGLIWAGTDRSGIFSWDTRSGEHSILPDWNGGEVISLATQEGMVWTGTRDGVVSVYMDGSSDGYSKKKDPARSAPIPDLLVDMHGSVWWCDGSEELFRSDPAILIVEEHEGLDLRNASALCADHLGRVWFATTDGLFHHRGSFAGDHQIVKVPVRTDIRTPITSLAALADGTIVAATFGAGIIVVPPVGPPRYLNSSNSPLNDNVLSVKVHDNDVWLATFEGLGKYSIEEGVVQYPLPFPGFIYDVLPVKDHSVMAATDGNGILRFDMVTNRWEVWNDGAGTFYSLTVGPDGDVWAAGPGTGFCRVGQQGITCDQSSRPPFDGDLYALTQHSGHLVAVGSTGVLAYDPHTRSAVDLTAALGLEDIQADLNAVTHDREGFLWLATDRGLVRLLPSGRHFVDRIRTVIRSVQAGTSDLGTTGGVVLPYDHERISILFTGIHWADPGAVRFEYRLLGADQSTRITRDRVVYYSGLAPGDYTFQVRSFTGGDAAEAELVSFHFTISAPIWKRAWFIILALLFVVGMIMLLLKIRDRRLREKERMEREKVRFQLEALRSQVDPHFLFNSFNTLVALIESDATSAVEHVEKLSLFFRNILLVRDKELISLEEEIALLQNYFALEEHRFGDAISLEVDIHEADRKKGVVPLTLQLLVENALKHNSATLLDPLRISVHSHQGTLVVSNPIRPRLSAPRSTGFGLESIQKRYGALTSKLIVVEPGEQQFIVRIPLIEITHESIDHRG